MEYNGVVRIYKENFSDDNVVVELGFTINSTVKTKEFTKDILALLNKYNASPNIGYSL